MNYIKYGIALIPLIICGIFYWQLENMRENYTELLQSSTKTSVQLESCQTELADTRNSFQNQALRLETLSTNTIALEQENNRLQSELEGYKDREDVVKAKPTLVERRANLATKRLMCEYARATSPTGDTAEGCD